MRPIRSNSYVRAMNSPIVVNETTVPPSQPVIQKEVEFSLTKDSSIVVIEEPKPSNNFEVNVVIRNQKSNKTEGNCRPISQNINSVNERDSNCVNSSEQQLISTSSQKKNNFFDFCSDCCCLCFCSVWIRICD